MKELLCRKAKEARNNAYTPYSGFTVGAAVLCEDGSIYTGCNIENAAFSPTVCAERVAVFKAVSDGKRDICAVAVCGARAGEACDKPCFPCGVCRQVLSEFCKEDCKIFIVTQEEIFEYTLSQLLPFSFDLA